MNQIKIIFRRFQPPQPHGGWNGTLQARNYQSICPQPDNNVYEEMSNGYHYKTQTSEDCLYLNIWTPEVKLNILLSKSIYFDIR